MDIWAWVRETKRTLREEGQHRLVELIERIPSATCNDNHGQVEALIPEALAEARRLENPWLELFFRHWLLQSRVLHRFECADNLTEAVDLVEFAHRAETRDCPQSRCVHQNLACAYGYIDGPGYAADRLSVADEALERIDPSWPCFTCISSERTNALVHAGRVEEALAYTHEVIEARKDAGRYSPDEFASEQIDVLLHLGRPEEALAALDAAEPWAPSDNRRVGFQIDRARILIALGRADEAVEHLPAFDAIAGTRVHYDGWIEALVGLVDAGVVRNTWQLEGQLARMTQDLVAHGILRISIDVLLTRGRLALARRSRESARWCRDQAAALVDGLRARAEVDAAIAELDVELAAAAEAAQPFEASDPDAALEALSGTDPEADLDGLVAILARWPDAGQPIASYASALDALGRVDAAIGFLETTVARQTAAGTAASGSAREIRLQLGHRYVATERLDALLALADRLSADPAAHGDDALADASWFRARVAIARGDTEAAQTHLETVLTHAPRAINTRLALADVLRERGELAAALSRLDEALEFAADDESFEPERAHWKAVAIATELGDWEALRAAGTALGMSFAEAAGPVDEDWGPIVLRFVDEGAAEDHLARRTGPVSATVLRVAGPDVAQHYGDRVVFDARPLEAPEDPETGLYVFGVERVLELGGWRAYPLIGIDPGDEALQALAGVIEAADGELHSFKRADPERADDDGRFVALAAIPSGVELAAFHERVAAWLEEADVEAELYVPET